MEGSLSSFQKAYVINLDRSPGRLTAVTENLRKQGLAFERIQAVDGANLSRLIRRDNATSLCANFCTDGQIGCGMSHMKAWRKVIEDDVDAAMIMEDDAKLVDGFTSQLNASWRDVPNDFDLVYVGCLVGCDSTGNDGVLSHLFAGFPFTQKGNIWKKVSDRVFIPKFALGLHCYIVSRAGAIKLLDLTEGKVSGHVDFQIQDHADKLNMYALNPALAFQIQKQSVSTIATSAFPVIPMKLFDRVQMNETLSLAYFLSCPSMQIGAYTVNTISVILLAVGVYFALRPRYLPMFLKIMAIIMIPDLFISDHFVPLVMAVLLVAAPNMVRCLSKE